MYSLLANAGANPKMKSMRSGGYMNQTGIAQAQFTVSQKPTPRSMVKMQASIALSGDGAFEGTPDYMDKLNEMQEEASQKITEKMEQLKS